MSKMWDMEGCKKLCDAIMDSAYKHYCLTFKNIKSDNYEDRLYEQFSVLTFFQSSLSELYCGLIGISQDRVANSAIRRMNAEKEKWEQIYEALANENFNRKREGITLFPESKSLTRDDRQWIRKMLFVWENRQVSADGRRSWNSSSVQSN